MADRELDVAIVFKDQISKGVDVVRTTTARTVAAVVRGWNTVDNAVTRVSDRVRGLVVDVGQRVGRGFQRAFAIARAAVLPVLALLGTFVFIFDRISRAASRAFGVMGRVIGNVLQVLNRFRRVLQAVIADYLETASVTDDFTNRLDFQTEAFQEWTIVAEAAGIKQREFAIGVQRATRRVAEAAAGMGEAQDALRELGVDVEALTALRADEQFEFLINRLSEVESVSDRVRLAFKLFDSEGVKLIQTIGLGSDRIEEFKELARALGVILSKDDVAAAKEAEFAFQFLGIAIRGVGFSIVRNLLPSLTRAARELVTFIASLGSELEPALDRFTRALSIAFTFLPDAIKTAWRFAVDNTDSGLEAVKELIVQAVTLSGTVIVQGLLTAWRVAGRVVVRLLDQVILPEIFDRPFGQGVRDVIDILGALPRGFAVIGAAIEAVFDFLWQNVKAGAIAAVNAVIGSFNFLVEQVAKVDDALGGLVGVRAIKVGEIKQPKFQSFEEFFTKLEKRSEEAIEHVNRQLGKIIAKVPLPEGADVGKVIEQAVRDSEGDIRKLFDVIGKAAGSSAAALIERISNLPGGAEALAELKDSLATAEVLVDTSRAVEENYSDQADQLERGNRAANQVLATQEKLATTFEGGFLAGLFGGVDEEGQKIEGVIERMNNKFLTGVDTARQVSGGIFNAFKGLVLNLTSETARGADVIKSFLLSILDVAREVAAQLAALALTRALFGLLGGVANSPQTGGEGGPQGVFLPNEGQPLNLPANTPVIQAQPLARGGIMQGRMSQPIPFNSYQFGGVANGPQLALFGEGAQREAFVPLPDGRRIPVSLQGEGFDQARGGGRGGAPIQYTDQRKVEIRQENNFNGGDTRANESQAAANRDALRRELLTAFADDDRLLNVLRTKLAGRV